LADGSTTNVPPRPSLSAVNWFAAYRDQQPQHGLSLHSEVSRSALGTGFGRMARRRRQDPPLRTARRLEAGRLAAGGGKLQAGVLAQHGDCV
jgi:hypothetical protein